MVKNPSGFTFVEVLVASLILIIGLWGTMSVVSFANRTEMLKTRSSQKDAIVYSLMQDLRKRSELLQKTYTGDLPNALLADPATFPLAWDSNQNVQALDDCPTCRGRVAYVVQPVTGYSDFFLATIRICADATITSCENYEMFMVTK